MSDEAGAQLQHAGMTTVQSVCAYRPHKAKLTRVSQMVRLTIRATDESVPSVMLKMMEERIGAGVSTLPETHFGPTPSEISDSFSNIMVRD